MAPSTEKAHAKYSASSSERWLKCPGSIRLSEKAPPKKSSAAADEGTIAHGVLEELMKTLTLDIDRSRPFTRAFQLKKKHPVEMVDGAMMAFIHASEIHRNSPEAKVHSELKVSLEHVRPGMFGTADIVVAEEFGRLHVIDFKYGKGIEVPVEENSQLLYYALGAAHMYDYNFEDVELTIVQPRLEDVESRIKTWVTPIKTLFKWEKIFKQGVAACERRDAELHSGSWCKFCPAKVICPKISTDALEAAKADFSLDAELDTARLTLPEVQRVQVPQLGAILSVLPALEMWATAVREHAFDALNRGEKIPGWKLVEKRGTRKWLDAEETANEALFEFGDVAFRRDLLSPAQLEKEATKLFGPEGVKPWVKERAACISSGLTLVPESDSRPAVSRIDDEFDALLDECLNEALSD